MKRRTQSFDRHHDLRRFDSAVVVAMVPVGMMKVPVDQVVNVVTVWHAVVTTIRPVLVILGMGAAIVAWRTTRGVGCVHGEVVFLNFAVLLMMQMPIVKIIDVSVMDDAGVAAAGTMLVRVAFVMCSHVRAPLCRCDVVPASV